MFYPVFAGWYGVSFGTNYGRFFISGLGRSWEQAALGWFKTGDAVYNALTLPFRYSMDFISIWVAIFFLLTTMLKI